MKFKFILLSALTLLSFVCTAGTKKSTDIKDIHIRDPFILVDRASKTYYMYRSAHGDMSEYDGRGGVEVFKSKDLKNWEGPQLAMVVPEDNWITGRIWAPEVHAYNGKYYMFATVNSDIIWQAAPKDWAAKTFRGVQVYVADRPEGPFKAFSRFPHTPVDEMALDGTLWVEDGKPYMVYCHEWVQTVDGEMCVMALSDNLSKTEGRSIKLFNASAAKWSTGSTGKEGRPKSYVTDGCFLYKTKTGKLLMIWSSFMYGQYALGIAESMTGSVMGPWKQNDEPLFSANGGHGMIFKSLEGKLYLVLHSPNDRDERATFIELEDTGDTLIRK